MALTRLFTKLRQKIVSRLGEVGGPRSDDVDAELNNIVSGVNDTETRLDDIETTLGFINIKSNGFIVGYPKCIRNARPANGNVGGGLDTLESYDLPVGNLLTNGDFVDVVYTVSINTNDNNKRLQLTIGNIGGAGGTVVLNTTLQDLDNFAAIIWVRVSRVNDTTVDVTISTIAGNAVIDSAPSLVSSVGQFLEAEFNVITVSDLDTNVLNFLLEAEGTANNDLVLFTAQVHVTQMT